MVCTINIRPRHIRSSWGTSRSVSCAWGTAISEAAAATMASFMWLVLSNGYENSAALINPDPPLQAGACLALFVSGDAINWGARLVFVSPLGLRVDDGKFRKPPRFFAT